MSSKILTTAVLSIALGMIGCEQGQNPPPGTTTPTDSGDVEINVDAADSPAENRAERREERRERLRDAVDNVNVDVGDGGVNVDVE